MHFFYLDESGDTGRNLNDANQPIFVLAGLSVSDKKWNNTKDLFDSIISRYFGGNIPQDFELHATQLLSPNGEGPFQGHDIVRRLQLTKDLLNMVADLGHYIHYFAIDKRSMNNHTCVFNTVFNNKTPYLVAFDYLITYINWHVKQNLGQSARGMIVMDEKDEHHDSVESIIHNRRYELPNAHRVKWIVEFSYPVDSKKNPMIQLSDLIALCIRRFLEYEFGFRTAPQDVKQFYAACFNIIDVRVKGRNLIERTGRNLSQLNDYLVLIQSKPGVQWRRAYNIRREDVG